jgi:Asp-tRNA(Asn)/Glu-tRNA(Gln) amidotransferase A subunit family amidase
LDSTQGPTPGATQSPPRKEGPYLAEVAKEPRRLRIGVVLKNPLASELDPECRAAVERAIKLCQSLGHIVDDVTESFSRVFAWDELLQAQVTFFVGGTALHVKQRLAELGRELRQDDVEPGTREWLKKSRDFTAADFARAHQVSSDASMRMAVFQRDYDVILTSTLGKTPIDHGVLTLQKTTTDLGEFLSFTPFTFLANFTGVPAMSVPLHWTSQGNLPVGVHFFGRYGDEATLFRLAGQLEATAPWKRKRPPL